MRRKEDINLRGGHIKSRTGLVERPGVSRVSPPRTRLMRGKEWRMDQEIHKSADDARAGTTPHIVRYVLTVSLMLALLAMVVLFLWGTTQS